MLISEDVGIVERFLFFDRVIFLSLWHEIFWVRHGIIELNFIFLGFNSSLVGLSLLVESIDFG